MARHPAETCETLLPLLRRTPAMIPVLVLAIVAPQGVPEAKAHSDGGGADGGGADGGGTDGGGTDGGGADDGASAEALFRAGREAIQEGDYAAACERFRESDQVQSAVGTWLNLGLCEEKLGHLVKARAYYQRVVQAAAAADRRSAAARAGIESVDGRLPRVILVLAPDAPASTVVSLGTAEHRQADFGVEFAVDPGEQIFIVRADGHLPKEYRVVLREGERRRVLVAPSLPERALPSEKQPSTPAPMTAPRAEQPSRVVGWGMTLGGAALLLASGVGGLVVLREKDMMQHNCGALGCTPDGIEAARNGRFYSDLSTASFAVGLLGAGLGTYLLVLTSQSSNAPRISAGPVHGGFFCTAGGTL